MNRNSGIALIAVMAALMILSAIALSIAASVQVEARIDRIDFDALQAEQLAHSGQEFAAFLDATGMNRTGNLLAGLPFDVIDPGFHYRAQTEAGTVEIYFESDNGRLNLSTAAPELLGNLLELWTEDSAKAQTLTAAIEDWRDVDSDVRPGGAEAGDYPGLNYSPRNGVLGIGDVLLIRGFSMEDFRPKWISTPTETRMRHSLGEYISDTPSGAMINPNFAPELLLKAVPGLSHSDVASILRLRADRRFADSNDFQARLGVRPDSPVWRYLSLSRSAPATTTIAKLRTNGITRSERRVVYNFTALNLATGAFEPKSALGRVERNSLSNFDLQ